VPDLSFEAVGAEAVPFAAAPLLALKLRLANLPADEPIHTVVLRCQIQIEVTRRRYDAPEQARLHDLFGKPQRWGDTMRSMLWTNAAVVVPAFAGTTAVDLQVPCSFDLTVAANKYFYSLDDGDVPLRLMFSGTVFYAGGDEQLQVAPISWDKEVQFRLPVRLWKETMDLYYPNSSWLCLRRDVFDRLYSYKVRHGITTWEEALERLLPASKETFA
jgi:Family of unknown function (DUF6084)